LAETWAPKLRLLNTYGVTEATVYQTCHQCVPSQLVVAGEPLRSVRVRVDDRGEVLLAGVQLAEGYWGQPDLTAQRFVQDEVLGCRAFRTGDLGSWAGGVLTVFGRCDNQVKVRGLRVELEEVEAVLRACSLVSQCAVAKVGEALVAACVVPAGGAFALQHGGEAALRLHCQAMMPLHQVPVRFVAVEQLPLTTSGKVDRRGAAAILSKEAAPTPAVKVVSGNSDAGRRVPRSLFEKAVAEAWQEALGLEVEPGLDARFWDLGGTSASALEMLSALERRLGGGFAVGEAAHVRLCGLLRKPRLQDYARFVEWVQARPPTMSCAGVDAGVLSAAPWGGEGTADTILALAEAELGGADADRALHAAAALLLAAGHGLREVCGSLLQLRASPDGTAGRASREPSPLMAAASSGQVAVCQLLLDARASVNVFDRFQLGPAHVAVRGRSLDVLCLLLDARAAIEAKDGQRWTPLHHAIWLGGPIGLNLLQALLSRRADLDAKDRWKRPALSYAVARGDKAAVRVLLDARAEPGSRLPQRALRRRGGEESWEPNTLLALRGGADDGWVALKWLLEARCAANLADDSGRTALHAAAADGSLGPAMEILLGARASVVVRDAAGRTPLHEAVAAGHASAAWLLLGAGADAGAQDSQGAFPHDTGAAASFPDLAAALRKAAEEHKESRPQALRRFRLRPAVHGDANSGARATRAVIQKGRFRIACTNEQRVGFTRAAPVCFACGLEGHVAQICTFTARCRRCSGPHETRTCRAGQELGSAMRLRLVGVVARAPQRGTF